MGFPGGSCSAGNMGLTPGWGRSPGEENGNPLQYSCLGNSMERRAWRATVHRVVKVRHDLVTEAPPPPHRYIRSDQIRSVAQSCPTPCVLLKLDLMWSSFVRFVLCTLESPEVFLFFINVYWCIVALQYCIRCRYIQLSYTVNQLYVYIDPSF